MATTTTQLGDMLARLQQALSKPRDGEVTQFAEKVVNFSSQYGTEGSNSYVAANWAGNLRVYHKYGDFVEAFVLVCCLIHHSFIRDTDITSAALICNRQPRPKMWVYGQHR